MEDHRVSERQWKNDTTMVESAEHLSEKKTSTISSAVK